MDNTNYCHIISQFKKHAQLPHHYYPSHNLLSIDNLLQFPGTFPESFPCYLPFEYEVRSNLVFLPGCNPTDHATDLVKKKRKWEKKLNLLNSCDLSQIIKGLKDLRDNKQTKLSARNRKYVEHLCTDPEPYFTGLYNWLYTGGSITSLEKNEGNTLVFADYSGIKPGFSLVKLSETLDKVEYKSFYQLKTFSPILQLACKSKSESIIICARQKNQVSLFRIDGTATLTQPTKLLRKKTLNNKIITCADISASCDQLVISDTNFDVHVFDIETRSKNFGYVGKDSIPVRIPDNWGQVSFGDFGLYVAFRDRMDIFDVRAECARPQLSFDPSPPTNDCEGITNMTPCNDPNYLYLAMSHHLLQVDLRNMKPVQKWTHLLKSPPLFVSSTQLDEREMLVLQSWKVDEVVGVSNDRVADDCFLSKSLPCLLRSVKETARLSRRQGVGLNPLLVKRVDFAITGIQCLKNDLGEVFMFAQNSGGDVFLNKIRKKIPDQSENPEKDEQEMLESVQALESQLEKIQPKPQKILDTVNMSHIIERLESSKGQRESFVKSDAYWQYHDMYHPESLSFCQDFLAQNLLKVWGYAPQESDQENEIELSHKKVLEWMDKI